MESEVMLPARRVVGALQKGFAVLAAFRADRPELGATELAQATGLDRTTVHRLLSTLTQLGVVVHDPQTRKYRLGLRLLDFSYALLDSLSIRSIAVPHLVELQREVNHVLSIALPDGPEVILVERLWGQETPLSLIVQVGVRYPIAASAMGRCILAYQSAAEVDRALQATRLARFTPKTITDKRTLSERLEVIRKRGFDISDEELLLGARALATPLRGPGGGAVAAIALTAPAPRVTVDELATDLAPRLVAVAERISMSLGFRGYAGVSQHSLRA